jgi:mono/diheme cytochrome c family protein
MQVRRPGRFVLSLNAFFLNAFVFLNVASAAPTPPVAFCKQVAPILYRHCVNCHRPGQIAGASSLLTYADAARLAEAIKEEVSQRKMPPWPADSSRSVKFRNDPRLTQGEIDTVIAWVKAGAPQGDVADLPPAPRFAEGWLHPKGLAPDLVITLPETQLPAEHEIPYLRTLVKVPVSEDKWIVAMQVQPGNPAVVHHMAITELVLPDGMTPENIDKLQEVARKLGFASGLNVHFAVTAPGNPVVYDMLGVYTPGTTFEMYEDGSGKLLKACTNCYLNFNIHYQTTGKPEKDQTRVAFWFASKPPKHQLFRVPASGETMIANGKQLLTDAPGDKAEGTTVVIPPIPPNDGNYEVVGVTAYTQPVTIYQFQPHAHLRGKDFTYSVVYPDGREQTLLTVPKYDFHWQLAYDLDEPLKLPAGSKLVVTAHYDNSDKNEHLLHHHGHGGDPEHIPGPDKEVYFRDMNQSWDEMFTPFVQYAIDNEEKPLSVVEVVGCLEPGKPADAWALTHATEPVVSKTQTTSSEAVRAAADKPLGNLQDRLLGVDVFHPPAEQGQKVDVKGVLIKTGRQSRINVTSLQRAGSGCS